STSSVIPLAVTSPLKPYRLVDSWNQRRVLFWIFASNLRDFTFTQQSRYFREKWENEFSHGLCKETLNSLGITFSSFCYLCI
ncbi:hypothetical protein, partial [Vibrio cholerae]|uniref:hypothetical protein n=1 Tax=Vibrio cholerae TaxID=666 RepID=UPI001F1AE467